MQRIESGVIYARKKSKYYVKITKSSECNGCRACGFGRKNHIIMLAQSNIDCEVGDTVSIRMPDKTVKGSYLYLYLLPLLLAFIGIMSAYGHGEKLMFLCGAIGLAVSFPLIYLIERLFRRKKGYLPVILGKIQSEEGVNND